MLRTVITRFVNSEPYNWLERVAIVWVAMAFLGIAIAVCLLSFPLMGVARLVDSMKD